MPGLIDKRWAGARPSGVARTRLIDDFLIEALHDGIKQVVILGSGYDCRAYRIPGIEQCKVFEVDQPSTLAAKQMVIQKKLGTPPPHVTFVEIDFNKQGLEDELKLSGFGMSLPAFFIWEGVTNYLTEEAVDSTITFVGATAPGSRIVFTYVHRDALDASKELYGTGHLKQTLKKVGEPWSFGFLPDILPDYLKRRGLKLIEDLGSVDYRMRYMNRCGSHLKGYEFYRAALAVVSEDEPKTGGDCKCQK